MTHNHSHVNRYVVSADLHRPVSQGQKVRDVILIRLED